MDETTLFENENKDNSPKENSEQLNNEGYSATSQAQEEKQVPKPSFDSPLYQPPSYEQDSQIPSDDSNQKSGTFPFQLILKILGGLIFIVLIILIVLNIFKARNVSSGKVTLVYWGLWEDNSVEDSIISGFEKQYPNITIDYQKQDIAQYQDRLETRIKEGSDNAPDVFRFHNSWTTSLKDVLAPVPSSVISTDDFSKTYYPVASKDLIKNGVLYGVPLEVDTLSMFINSDALSASGDKPPTNLEDDFLRVSADLTHLNNGTIEKSGVGMGTYDYINHAPDILAYLMSIVGVDFSNLNSSQNQKLVSESLDYYTKFAQTAQNQPPIWSDSLGQSLDAFSKGNLAIYFGYSWDIPLIKQRNKDLNFQIYPMPQLPPNKTTIASYWAEGVSLKSTHQKEAMLFLNYLTQKDTELAFYKAASAERGFGEPFARRDLASQINSSSIIYPFIAQAQYATSSYFSADTGQDLGTGLNGTLNQYLQGAINSILSSSNPQSPDTAAASLTTQVESVLPQYGY